MVIMEDGSEKKIEQIMPRSTKIVNGSEIIIPGDKVMGSDGKSGIEVIKKVNGEDVMYKILSTSKSSKDNIYGRIEFVCNS